MAVTIQTVSSSITDSAGDGVTGVLRIQALEEFEYDNTTVVVKVGTSLAEYAFTDGVLDATFDLVPNHGTGVDKYDADKDTGPLYRVDYEIEDGESWAEFWIIRVVDDTTTIEITDVELSAGVTTVADDCDAEDLLDQHVAEADPHPQYLLESEVSTVSTPDQVPRGDAGGKIDGDWIQDATAAEKGVVQLSGDLTGTAASPTVAAGAIDESKTSFFDLSIANDLTVTNDLDVDNSADIANDLTVRDELLVDTRAAGGGDGGDAIAKLISDLAQVLQVQFRENNVLSSHIGYEGGGDYTFWRNALSDIVIRILDNVGPDGKVAFLKSHVDTDDEDVRWRIFGSGANGNPYLELWSDNGGVLNPLAEMRYNRAAERLEVLVIPSSSQAALILKSDPADNLNTFEVTLADGTPAIPMYKHDFADLIVPPFKQGGFEAHGTLGAGPSLPGTPQTLDTAGRWLVNITGDALMNVATGASALTTIGISVDGATANAASQVVVEMTRAAGSGGTILTRTPFSVNRYVDSDGTNTVEVEFITTGTVSANSAVRAIRIGRDT